MPSKKRYPEHRVNLNLNLRLTFYPASQEAGEDFRTQMRIRFTKPLSLHWNLNVAAFETFKYPLVTKILSKRILPA